MQEMSKIKKPLDDFYKDKSGSIHTNMASIEPLQIRYKPLSGLYTLVRHKHKKLNKKL
jgi:hypothetical protein